MDRLVHAVECLRFTCRRRSARTRLQRVQGRLQGALHRACLL